MSEEFPGDDDGAVLKMLSEGGNDLTREMVIDYEVVVADQQNAEQIADAAEDAGFELQVFFDNATSSEEDSNAKPTWKCVCSKSMIPTHAGIQETKSLLDNLSRKFNGQLESWGTFGNAENSKA